jgi:MarR family transcriptional regulator, organic hydroperoxide resistance regulator
MSEGPLQETLCHLLAQVCKAHRQYACAMLGDLGLFSGQEILLMHLWESDGLSQLELGARMEIEPPTLTKMLNRLEKTGLVERRRDPNDARICRVYLTDKGWSLREPVTRCWRAIEQRVLTNLTLEEQILLRRLLLQVRHNLP